MGNVLGGIRGWSNLATWVIAGSLAYYFWVKPTRELQRKQEASIRISSYPILSVPYSDISWGSNSVSMVYEQIAPTMYTYDFDLCCRLGASILLQHSDNVLICF
ncbi:hypothetical protein PR202_gb11514 [Eleusine coracana subsp. coracana]|uniref:Uncharacterized protein n=1 Tax=Eleusine coracana subsp. coracana TaxID=191504 RepID=A0AAV5EN61_ELECO|nr:hypothetical protein PR202_gb11514 [Eleusine coracana subsp. coracana]